MILNNPVPESAEFIAKNSQNVSVDLEEIKSFSSVLARKFEESQYSFKNWKSHPLNPQENSESTLEWIFLIDSLNFCFWLDNGESFKLEYNGTVYSGYWTLCAAINRALDNQIPILDPHFLRSIQEPQLAKIFSPAPECTMIVPLLKERVSILNEIGAVLVDRFDGKVANLVKEANQSALKLLELVTTHFPNYRDEHFFRDRKVFIYKRAQILIADIWACFENTSYGLFHDIDQITMFADYRVPQTLVYFKLLKYTEDFRKVLDRGDLIPSGDPREVELRGCSIYAVEVLKDHLRQQLSPDTMINAILIDFYLWDYAKDHSQQMKQIPIHKTKSIFY